MVSIAQTCFAVIIAAGLIIFVSALHIAGRSEARRRAKLSQEDCEKLERDDAIWSQRFGF